MFFKSQKEKANDFMQGYNEADNVIQSGLRIGESRLDNVASIEASCRKPKDGEKSIFYEYFVPQNADWKDGFQSRLAKELQAIIAPQALPNPKSTVEETKGYKLAKETYESYIDNGLTYQEAHSKLVMNSKAIRHVHRLPASESFSFNIFICHNADILEKLDNGVSFLENCLKLEVS